MKAISTLLLVVLVLAGGVALGVKLGWLDPAMFGMEKAPAETPAPDLPPPQESAPRLAPPGVWFLTERVSVATDSGVLGFAPGQKVQFVEEKPDGTAIVSADGRDLTVRPSQITNDLDIAEAVRSHDRASQARVAAWMEHQRSLANKKEESRLAQLTEEERKNAEARRELQKLAVEKALSEPQVPSNPLERGAYNRTRAVWPHGRYYDSGPYYDRYGRCYYIDPWGRWDYR